MIRLLVNIVFFVLFVRVLQELATTLGRRFRGKVGAPPKPKGRAREDKGPANLSPYDIEDGDYEEIPSER